MNLAVHPPGQRQSGLAFLKLRRQSVFERVMPLGRQSVGVSSAPIVWLNSTACDCERVQQRVGEEAWYSRIANQALLKHRS